MNRPVRRLARLPLRARLVAGFVAAMMVVLVAAGAFVYWRVRFALDRDLDRELSDTSSQLAPSVLPSGRVDEAEPLLTGMTYQVVGADGTVLAHGLGVGSASLLNDQTLDAAAEHPVTVDIGSVLPASPRPLRVYATAAPQAPGTVLAVAARSDGRDEALRELLVQLVLAGLATLVVTAIVGDRLAKASLQPVERYRRQAADITAGASGIRLDVPAERDDEITRLGNTLNEMLDALEESLARERRFVDDASHELRTPLTLLRTRVELALRRARTADQYEHVLIELGTDVDRLSKLAEQLLAVGTTRSAARETSDGAGSDLAALTLDVAERRRTLAAPGSPYAPSGALGIAAEGPVRVGVSRQRLEQLVSNLLDNAALHGRPPVAIVVGRTDRTGRLVVTDAGDGMDDAMLAAAPERFARAPESRARPGSGLGLSLVLAIVEAAGGELRLCVGGRHECFGTPQPFDCDHTDAMTVTVLLPLAGGVEVGAEEGGAAAGPSAGTR